MPNKMISHLTVFIIIVLAFIIA